MHVVAGSTYESSSFPTTATSLEGSKLTFMMDGGSYMVTTGAYDATVVAPFDIQGGRSYVHSIDAVLLTADLAASLPGGDVDALAPEDDPAMASDAIGPARARNVAKPSTAPEGAALASGDTGVASIGNVLEMSAVSVFAVAAALV